MPSMWHPTEVPVPLLSRRPREAEARFVRFLDRCSCSPLRLCSSHQRCGTIPQLLPGPPGRGPAPLSASARAVQATRPLAAACLAQRTSRGNAPQTEPCRACLPQHVRALSGGRRPHADPPSRSALIAEPQGVVAHRSACRDRSLPRPPQWGLCGPPPTLARRRAEPAPPKGRLACFGLFACAAI